MRIFQEKMEKILQSIQSRNQRAINLYAARNFEMNLRKPVDPQGNNHIPLERNKFLFLWMRIICKSIVFYKLTLSLQSYKLTFVSKKGHALL